MRPLLHAAADLDDLVWTPIRSRSINSPAVHVYMPISVTSRSACHNIRQASDNRNPGDRLNTRGASSGRAAEGGRAR